MVAAQHRDVVVVCADDAAGRGGDHRGAAAGPAGLAADVSDGVRVLASQRPHARAGRIDVLDWAVALLLIALAGLLAAAWAFRDSEGRPRAGLVIAAAAIAPLLIWSQLAAAENHGRFGDLRLSVVSVKLAPDAIDGASIGGDRAHDFLEINDLPPSLITLHRISDREVGLEVGHPLRGEFAGAVAFETAEPDFLSRVFGASPRFAGERAVRPGEVFCPRGCAAPCRIRLPVDGDRLSLDGVAATDLPRM